jgi:hypothetical protein
LGHLVLLKRCIYFPWWLLKFWLCIPNFFTSVSFVGCGIGYYCFSLEFVLKFYKFYTWVMCGHKIILWIIKNVIPTSNNQESITHEKKNHTKHANSVEWKTNDCY